MKSLRWVTGVGALALLATGATMAAEVGGVAIADKTTVGGQELVLNGAGVRTRAIFKVYVASLYLPQKAGDLQAVLAKGPRRIQLNLLRTLSADQLAEALNDGLVEGNTPSDVAAVKPQADQLLAIMKAFNEVKDERNEADYSATVVPSPDEARDALAAAADFLDLCGSRYGFRPAATDAPGS